MRFFLGVHHPNWLAQTAVPLFVSRRRLVGYKTLPRARGPWCLDSGGFSELNLHGTWTVDWMTYIREVRRYSQIGRLYWAAQQDWMCEPFMLAKTGLTVREHQKRTVENYLLLVEHAPDLPWKPVLQGWQLSDYHDHLDQFREAGVDSVAFGLGSVCRRQATSEIEEIVNSLTGAGLRLHGFGVKTLGLARYAHLLESSDSMSWSFTGRRSAPIEGHTHKNCANCLEFALGWREKLLENLQA